MQLFDFNFEKGSVWLVGAGPGDPGLLSLLAYKSIKIADTIFYDDLLWICYGFTIDLLWIYYGFRRIFKILSRARLEPGAIG